MNDLELREYLLSEEQKTFLGWDFSYLDGRWDKEVLPWDYTEIINHYRRNTDHLLDMGTGGGEFILNLGHPYPFLSVTEGWQPNLQLCLERLAPLGITVKYVAEDDKLDYPDASFDLVINRHESYDVNEVYRVLKKGGQFITQQVGCQNDRELVEKLLGPIPLPFPKHDLKYNVELMQVAGFTLLEKLEEMKPINFYDLGAVVYFAKQCVWEFPGFSVEHNLEQLKVLRNELDQRGFISNQIHRFLIVAKKD